MKRISLWLLILMAGLLAWPNLATGPAHLETAVRAQQEIVDREPGNALAWNDLGNLYLVDDQLGRAEDAYRRAIEVDPSLVAAHFNLALLLQQTGKAARAEQALRRVIELDPHHAWAHYQLGVVLERKRERAKALDHYARALAYDPSLSFAKNNPHVIENEMLGEALLRSQDYSDPPGKRVPRQYGEADRIVDLILRGQTAGEAAPAPGVALDEMSGDEMSGDKTGGDETGGGEVGGGDTRGGGSGGTLGDAPGTASANGTTPRPRTGEAARDRASDDRDNLTRVTLGSRPSPARRVAGQAAESPDSPAARPDAERRPIPSRTTRETGVPERRTLTREDLRTRGSSTTPPSSRSGSDRAVPPPPPPRSSRYIPPSRRSTGQLELELLPETAAAERWAVLEPGSPTVPKAQ